MKEIKGFIIDYLEHENRMLKKNLTKNKRALQSPSPVSFSVESYYIDSNDKEKYIHSKNAYLETAMENSIKSLKKINDIVELFHIVTVHLQNGTKIEIPKKYWGDILRKLEKK